MTHAFSQGTVELTYDPAGPIYTITITKETPWPDAAVFGMRFDGPQGRVIATDRHVLSNNGQSLTVTDRGFGNVLDGLQYNSIAMAAADDAQVSFSLIGAAEPVAAFRACRGDFLTG